MLFVFHQGESTVSLRSSSIHLIRLYGSIVEIQYGHKQTMTVSKYGNEGMLRCLCHEFMIGDEEVNRHWSG